VTAQGDRTKDRLIQATTTLVAQVGYHQATTRAIAKLAGVAEGTLYRHYPDKRSLFFAAVLAGHQPVLDWMTELPGRAGTAPVADILTECLTQLWQLRRTVLPLELALAADPDVTSAAPAQLDLPAIAAAGGPPHLLAQYLAAEQQHGRIRPDLDPGQIAVVLLATLFGLALNPTAGPGATNHMMIRAAVTITLYGIAPNSAE
jgi:AcrR family transcriptional regulator